MSEQKISIPATETVVDVETSEISDTEVSTTKSIISLKKIHNQYVENHQMIANSVGIVANIITVVSLVFGIAFGLATLSSWKESVISPVRQQIVSAQVTKLLDCYNLLGDFDADIFLDQSNYVTISNYISEAGFRQKSDRTKSRGLLASFLSEIDRGVVFRYSIGDSKNLKGLTYDVLMTDTFLTQGTHDFVQAMRKLEGDYFLSTSIRKELSDIELAIFTSLQTACVSGVDLSLKYIEKSASAYNEDSLMKIMKNIPESEKVSIQEKINKLRVELKDLLRIDELYKIRA